MGTEAPGVVALLLTNPGLLVGLTLIGLTLMLVRARSLVRPPQPVQREHRGHDRRGRARS